MGKTKRDSVPTTELSFHKHYTAIWAEERWQNSLYPALAAPTRYAALINRFSTEAAYLDHEHPLPLQSLQRISFPNQQRSEPPRPSSILAYRQDLNKIADETPRLLPHPSLAVKIPGVIDKLTTHWNLDAASLLAVHLLNVQAGDNVLDLCAAPGGKSLALAQCLWPQLHQDGGNDGIPRTMDLGGSLCSNEVDAARFKRLEQNLRSYLPARLFSWKLVGTTQIDGTDALAYRKLSRGGEGYDKVLVDAPCSSERHIIHAHLSAQASGKVSAPEMANWRPGSSKRLVNTQVELLITALRCVKVGGRLLYATCSFEMGENDGVVEKVLAWVRKEGGKGGIRWGVKVGFDREGGEEGVEAVLEREWAERTKFGWIVLPDHPAGWGWGPLFFVVLTKVEADG